MTKEITQLRKLFYMVLEDKTGWGRNELKRKFEECVNEVISGNADNSNLLNSTAYTHRPQELDIDALFDENIDDNNPPWD